MGAESRSPTGGNTLKSHDAPSAGSYKRPHVPPFFAQCAQYLQFLQALQGSAPVQVANIPSELKPEASTTAHIKNPTVVMRMFFISSSRDNRKKCSPCLEIDKSV